MKESLILVFSVLVSVISVAQPDSLWGVVFAGSKSDRAEAIVVSETGSVFLKGSSTSRDGDFTGNEEEIGAWAAKVSEQGQVEWINVFDDGYNERIGGISLTHDGNLLGVGGREIPGRNADFWVFLLNPSGQMLWEVTYGGTESEGASTALALENGHYLIAGGSYSSDGDKTDYLGGYDIWLIELDKLGNLVWETSLGGSGDDEPEQIIPHEGGYLILGTTLSDDGQVTHARGGADIWLVKVDSVGHVLWDRSYGGSDTDYSIQMIKKENGGYLLLGATSSTDQQIYMPKGETDFWLVELSPSFIVNWSRNLGGSNSDLPDGLFQTHGNTFILAGQTSSEDGDISTNKGSSDGWILEVDHFGEILWEKTIGTPYIDLFYSIAPSTTDEGFFIAMTKPDQWNYFDALLIKYGPPYPKLTSEDTCPSFSLSPNPLPGSGLSIRFPEPLTFDGQIRLFDMLGREFFGAPAYFGGLEYSFTLPENLPPGQYVVELQGAGLLCREKLMVVR